MPWTLQLTGGATKTLDEWGLSGVTLSRESLGNDLLEATLDGSDFDADDLFAYGAYVTLRDPNDVVRFVGQRVLLPGAGSGPAETQQLTFAGPWWWLEKLIFHLTWPLPGGAVGQTTHLILNAAKNVGQQIADVIDYAIAQGAPMQRAAIALPTQPPVSEVVDQYCAPVIADQLRWVPDAQIWFDYTTSPPTFHCEARSALERIQLTLPGATGALPDDGRLVELTQITPRPDQLIAGVALHFEQSSNDNGVALYNTFDQVYPPGTTGREFNAIAQTIVLAGFNRVSISAEIECETIDLTSLAFWKNRIPALDDDNVLALSIVTGTEDRTGTLALPRMLVNGEIPPWLLADNGGSLTVEEETISVQVRIKVYDRDESDPDKVTTEESDSYPLSVTILSCDAPAGVTEYSQLAQFDEGETVPADLAQYIYTSLSTLEYEGSVQFVEQECTGAIGPGNKLGFLNTRPEYATLEARVQRVVEHIESGTTQITFGPSPILSIDSLLELLRANRIRQHWTASSVLQDGNLSAQNNVSLGKYLARENAIPASPSRKTIGVSDGADATQQLLATNDESGAEALPALRASDGGDRGWNLRVADCVYNGVHYQLQIRAVQTCRTVNGIRQEGILLIPSSEFIPIA